MRSKQSQIALFVTLCSNGLFFDSCLIFSLDFFFSFGSLIIFNVLLYCRVHSLYSVGTLTFDILSFCTVIIFLFCYHVSVLSVSFIENAKIKHDFVIVVVIIIALLLIHQKKKKYLYQTFIARPESRLLHLLQPMICNAFEPIELFCSFGFFFFSFGFCLFR